MLILFTNFDIPVTIKEFCKFVSFLTVNLLYKLHSPVTIRDSFKYVFLPTLRVS